MSNSFRVSKITVEGFSQHQPSHDDLAAFALKQCNGDRDTIVVRTQCNLRLRASSFDAWTWMVELRQLIRI